MPTRSQSNVSKLFQEKKVWHWSSEGSTAQLPFSPAELNFHWHVLLKTGNYLFMVCKLCFKEPRLSVDIPTTFYAQYFQEMSVVPRSILGKHLFSQCVIPHLPELRSHWEVVSTVISVEKCFKGLQEFCHFLLQPICTLDNRAGFKEISSPFSVFYSLSPTLLYTSSLGITIYRSTTLFSSGSS